MPRGWRLQGKAGIDPDEQIFGWGQSFFSRSNDKSSNL